MMNSFLVTDKIWSFTKNFVVEWTIAQTTVQNKLSPSRPRVRLVLGWPRTTKLNHFLLEVTSFKRPGIFVSKERHCCIVVRVVTINEWMWCMHESSKYLLLAMNEWWCVVQTCVIRGASMDPCVLASEHFLLHGPAPEAQCTVACMHGPSPLPAASCCCSRPGHSATPCEHAIGCMHANAKVC
jgi:hypothetical protein